MDYIIWRIVFLAMFLKLADLATTISMSTTHMNTPKSTLSSDKCAPKPCKNGGTCIYERNEYTCTCAARYTDKNCQTYIDECAPKPCLNGGTCTDGVNGYTCSCAAGHTDNNCQTDINECDSNPCQHKGNCTDRANGYTCTCAAGFKGVHCEIDINECDSNPCQHESTCTDGVNTYTCTCAAGYTENNCETNINECASKPCQNGGTCTDEINAYTCHCADGYTDNNCQTNINECVSTPCQNGGTCTDGINAYTCHCADGYTDNNCQTNIKECASNPCQNGGTCTDGINAYICKCADGYTDNNCRTNIPPPRNVSLQDVSTTGFIVNIEKSTFPNFMIKINSTELQPVYTNKTEYQISGLTPGKCYRTDVFTIVQNKRSGDAVVRNICLYPARPRDIYLIGHESTNSRGIGILRGSQIVNHFDILINNEWHSSVIPSSQRLTTTTLRNLIPGSLYNNVSVRSVANGLNSSATPLSEILLTVPVPPESVDIVNPSHKQVVTLKIKKGLGKSEYFRLYWNNTKNSIKMKAVSVHNSKSTTCNITDLLPGRTYSVNITTVSHNLTSAYFRDDIFVFTKPNTPMLQVNDSATTEMEISGHIYQKDGGTDSFYLSSEEGLNYTIQGSRFTIFNLEPGQRYNLWATATYHHQTSDKTSTIIVCTEPASPQFEIVNKETTTNSLLANINLTVGGKNNFEIYCNELLMTIITTNDTLYRVVGLEPGNVYDCYATANFCKHTSAESNIVRECTVPNPPTFLVDHQSTTNTLHGHISQPNGGSDNFTIYCDGSTKLNFSIYGSTYMINNLQPGTRYSCQASATFCSHTSAKSTKWQECTAPVSPKFTIDHTSTFNTLHGDISQPSGGIDNFTIYCSGIHNLNFSINGSRFKINNLQPGTRYDCQASTTFCNHTSEYTESLQECTVPSTPNFSIDHNSTVNTLHGNIFQQNGGSDNFTIQCTGAHNSNVDIKGSRYVVSELQPGTRYSCQASTSFCSYTSKKTALLSECTVPNPPILTIDNKSTNSTLKGYIYQQSGESEKFTIFCNGTTSLDVNGNNSKYTLKHLQPGTRYNCRASTTFCSHTSELTESFEGCTVPSTPHLRVFTNLTTMEKIFGKIAAGLGGKDTFKLSCENEPNLNYSFNGDDYVISSLLPGKVYRLKASTIFCSHESARTQVFEEYTVPMTPRNAIVTKSTNETIDIQINNKNSKDIGNYTIFLQPISNASCAGKMVQRNGKDSITIDSLSAGTIYKISIFSNFHDKRSQALIMKHATDPSPPVDVSIKERKKDSVTIEIIKGKGCVKSFTVSVNGKNHNVNSSTNSNVTTYIIRELDSATTYSIKVTAVSNGAHQVERSSIQISLTTEKDPVPVAIGGVVGALSALIAIIIVVFSWRRKALCFKKKIGKQEVQESVNSGFEEEVELEDTRRKRPIKVTDFHRHVEMMSRNTHMKFSQEFKELGLLSPKHSTDISQIQENRPKNRYTNILPFDHSIVKLIGMEDEVGSDFINANYVPGKKSKREFIATQGPLPSTKEEMWRMIWEQNVSIVVMLTQLIERGRKKCEIYWPENVNEKMFLGDIIVEVETISHLPNYTLRTITLQLGDVERRIKHYNYLAWPDMGTPKTTDIMINFVDTVRKEVKPNMKGPIVVHCSAGVGRTGTFIMMDILLQEIRSKCTEVDIFGMILNMRNYRLNMVQTEDQYIFIHNCVKDLIDVSDDEEEQNGFGEQHEPIYQNC